MFLASLWKNEHKAQALHRARASRSRFCSGNPSNTHAHDINSQPSLICQLYLWEALVRLLSRVLRLGSRDLDTPARGAVMPLSAQFCLQSSALASYVSNSLSHLSTIAAGCSCLFHTAALLRNSNHFHFAPDALFTRGQSPACTCIGNPLDSPLGSSEF